MGGLIPPATLEQIRAASDIVEVIGSYIPLKRAGGNFVALCPFHREKSPSFNVNPHRQIFHCFGCHKGGDVFKFVQDYENIGFMDSVRRLAERARIPLQLDSSPGAKDAANLKDKLLQIHELIAQRWQAALASDPNAQIARDYLAKRSVPPQAVQLFRLGFAPDLWDDTVNWAKSKNFDLPLVEQSGLIIRKPDSQHFYDRFRGRLIFPICDEQGRVIAFSGRILSGDEKTAKYVNSPESPIFTKGKVMFGLDKSKRALLESHSAIICEGQLDLIACFMAGVKNVVAPQGTALTSDHTRILKRYVEEVILCFDSDNAGQNAAVRSLDSLLASGLSIRVATVPSPHDPDSFIKQFGGPAFAKLIAGAHGFFDYYLDRLCATNDLAADRGRHAVAQAMSDAVHKTANDVLIDTYAQKTALRLGVAADAMRREFEKPVRSQLPVADDDEPSTEDSATPPPPADECWLLRVLLENDDLVEWAASRLDPEWLTHAGIRQIIISRLQALTGGSWSGVAPWLSQLENPAWQSLVTSVLAEKRPVRDASLFIKGSPTRDSAIKVLRDKFIDRRLADLSVRLAAPDADLSLWRQQDELRQLKRQPLAPRNIQEPQQ